MDAPRNGPKPPTHLSIKLPADVAEILHRLAYETGRSKRDLVIDAVRRVYGENA
jgi:predicted transcriptional regulator